MRPSLNPQADTRAAINVTGGLQAKVLSGANPSVITPGATPVIDATRNNVFTLTPAEAETLSIIGMLPGQEIKIILLTSGVVSFLVTLGAGFVSAGTLLTGTVSGKYFILSFLSDGTSVFEVSRTTAL